MLRVLAVTNLYPTPYTPTSGTFIEQQVQGLRQIGLNVEVMLVDRIQQGKSAYINLAKDIRSKIIDFQPDVVHVMYGGVMAAKVTRTVLEKPVVVSFCGTDLLGEPLVAFHRKLVRRYGVWASHRAARRASAIVVKSKNLQDALPSNIDRSKVCIIPNGVDLDRFKPMKRNEARRILGWPQDTAIVLFVTVGGHPRKRPQLAQEAFSKIGACDFRVEFRIMQGVRHEQVPLWLNASDVLILTSVHEGGVNIVKEAMACNLPIVSVDVGDVRERLNGVRGCVIVGDDSDTLGRALSQVLCRGERSDGRAHIHDLTITKIAERLKEVYSQVIDRHDLSDGRVILGYHEAKNG